MNSLLLIQFSQFLSCGLFLLLAFLLGLLFAMHLVARFAFHGHLKVLFDMVRDECLTEFVSLLTMEDDLAVVLNFLSLLVAIPLASVDLYGS